MASPALVLAAQTNGRKSQGPKTAAGKRRSSANSYKHGLYGKTIPFDAQCTEDFHALRAAYTAEYHPRNEFETLHVHHLALNEAREKWAMRTEALLVDLECAKLPPELDTDTRLVRAYDNLIRALSILQSHENRFSRRADQSRRRLIALRYMRERTVSPSHAPDSAAHQTRESDLICSQVDPSFASPGQERTVSPEAPPSPNLPEGHSMRPEAPLIDTKPSPPGPRVMLIGIRGTMRMRFANSAVLFSFGFSPLTETPAQFRRYSGDENHPVPAPAGAPGDGPHFRATLPCKSLQPRGLRIAGSMTDHAHGTSIKVIR